VCGMSRAHTPTHTHPPTHTHTHTHYTHISKKIHSVDDTPRKTHITQLTTHTCPQTHTHRERERERQRERERERDDDGSHVNTQPAPHNTQKDITRRALLPYVTRNAGGTQRRESTHSKCRV
jgi:hypothetical protein